MTVATSTNRADFTGNGSTTVFPFTFRIFAATDLVVTVADLAGVETELVLGTDYTVSGAGSYNGGNVTLASALTDNYALTIAREVPITQETDLRNQGAFFAETHEDVFDRLTMVGQQLQEQIDRCAKLPITNTADAEALVADIVLLADNLSMLATVAGGLADITTVADDLNEVVSEIETVAASIANVNTVGAAIAAVNTVATAIANVNTVATNIANVNAVASNSTNINAVNSNSSNINTVAGINANVTTVAGIAANVSTVAGISSAVSTVATNNTNVSTVATNIANVNTAATNIAAIIDAPAQASAAASSAASASASAAAAASSLDSFDDRYLGSKSSPPTVDNDGDPLVTGALYYDTVQGKMYVWDGAQWIQASSAQQAALATYEYVATAGQTSFSGPDANALTLSYIAGGLIVSLNGVILRPGDDYTATNGTSIVLVSAAALNDELCAYAFNSFNVANTYTQAQSDSRYAQLAAAQTFTASQRGTVTTDNDLSFDLSVTNNFSCTPTGAGTLTFTNRTAGQSGFVLLINTGGHTISAHANTKVSTTALATISAAGTYLLSYFTDGSNTFVVNSGALA